MASEGLSSLIALFINGADIQMIVGNIQQDSVPGQRNIDY